MGPLFFSIFFKDLPFILDCDLETYADDSTLLYSSKDPVVIEERLTRNCDHVSVWMRQNRLKLNTDKTHFLTIGTSNKIGALTSQINVKIDGQNIEENDEKCEKLLGINIQSNLKRGAHLNKLKSRLKLRLAGLYKLRFMVPEKNLN